jgi:hypothetical protein
MSDPVVAAIAQAEVRLGQLAANFQVCETLRAALRSGQHAFDLVPSSLMNVIRLEAWRDQIDHNLGAKSRKSYADFKRFIEAPVADLGCGVAIETVCRILGDATLERIEFERAIRGERGGPNNPRGTNQHTKAKCDNVTLGHTEPPASIPFSPNQERDFKPPTGNHNGYAFRRLERGRPDLFARVQAGELTPNAAMLEAGYRKPTVAVLLEPEAATRQLVRHFQRASLIELIRGLADWAGYDLVERT